MFTRLTVSTLILFLSATSYALAQGRGNAYGGMQPGMVIRRSYTPPAEDLEWLRGVGYVEGYSGRPANWRAHARSNIGANAYNGGYYAGRAQRVAEENDARQKEPPKPLELPKSPEPPATGFEEAQYLAKDFTARLNAMKEAADKLDALLSHAGPFPAFAGTPSERRARQMEYTTWNLERVRLQIKCHEIMNAKAYEAEQIRPKLIAVFRQVSAEINGGAGQVDFADIRQLRELNVKQCSQMATDLEASPVTLPDGFERTGQYLTELEKLLDESLHVETLLDSMASEGGAVAAYESGFNKMYMFFADWRDKKLEPWQASELPRPYHALNIAPPEKQTSSQDLQEHLSFRSGDTPTDPQPAPSTTHDPDSPTTGRVASWLGMAWVVLCWAVGVSILVAVVCKIIFKICDA